VTRRLAEKAEECSSATFATGSLGLRHGSEGAGGKGAEEDNAAANG